MIPHSRPLVSGDDLLAVSRVLRSGHIACGDEVRRFEEEFARFAGCRYAICLSSGTAALHVSLLALGIGAGDRVAMPSFVCSALLHATLATGAKAVPVDTDPSTFNIDPDSLRKCLQDGITACIVPHMFGRPDPVALALDLDVPIVEDCAMATGARQGGKRVGTSGVSGVFSFYATKMITTGGEGGMVVTDDAVLAEAVRDLLSCDGKGDDRVRHNYKMTDMAAAMGRSQLARLEDWIARRREIAAEYDRRLSGLAVKIPERGVPDGHVFYRYVMRSAQAGDHLISEFERRGVAARRPVSQPIHRLLGLDPSFFPGAEEALREALSLPVYPGLTEAEQGTVILSVLEILGGDE